MLKRFTLLQGTLGVLRCVTAINVHQFAPLTQGRVMMGRSGKEQIIGRQC